MFLCSWAPAQSKTNLEIFYSLVDSSVVRINNAVPSSIKEIKINFNGGKYFSVFQNQVIYNFVNLGRTVIPDSAYDPHSTKINYALENAGVQYGEMERDGFFGGFLLPRKLKIDGSYSVENGVVTPGDFHFAYQDTISVDDIENLENPSFPFTQGKVPPEPFFSSLFEPVVAIGSAALAVILFFTVRSK